MAYTSYFGLGSDKESEESVKRIFDPWTVDPYMGKKRAETSFDVPLLLSDAGPKPFPKHQQIYFPGNTRSAN
jgi:hypothetical protein